MFGRPFPPVDKSVVYRLARESSPFKNRQFPQQRVEVSGSALVHVLDVEQVGVSHDRRLALADGAMSDQAIVADLATSEQRPGRSGSDAGFAKLTPGGTALIGRIEPQAPMREEAGVHEHRRRPQGVAERKFARPFQHWIREQHDPASTPY